MSKDKRLRRTYSPPGARCSSVVRAFGGSLMVRLVVGSILYGGPIELFLVPASAPRLLQQRPWYVLSYLWDDAYKRTLAANGKSSPCDGSVFPL